MGSSPGSASYFNSGTLGTNLTATALGLPTDGSQVHVRLWYRTTGGWQFLDYQYTAVTPVIAPAITSPAAGSTFSASNVTFVWTANGNPVTGFWLYIGTAVGAADLFNSGWLGTTTSVAVAGLPTDGSQIHARFWYFMVGGSPSISSTPQRRPLLSRRLPVRYLDQCYRALPSPSTGQTMERCSVDTGCILGLTREAQIGTIAAG